MNWYSYETDNQGRITRMAPIVEPNTVARLGQMVGIAIYRWLASGLDCPDETATDGVSAFEAAMEWE